MHIEVEIKSFLAKEQYDALVERFAKEGTLLSSDDEITYYFDSAQDIRIFKNSSFSKLVMKKGKLDDEQREELEIKCPLQDFDKLERFLNALGIHAHIKWFRNRKAFSWQGISAMLDNTQGHGYMLELEKLSSEQEKDAALALLKSKLALLGVQQTPREELQRRFQHYKEHWKELTGDSSEQ